MNSSKEPPRSVRGAAGIVLILTLTLAAGSSLSGQRVASCALSLRAGVAVPSEESDRIDGTQVELLGSGSAVALSGSCPFGGPWLASVAVERSDVDDAVFWDFSGALGAARQLAPGTVLSGHVRAGWRISDPETLPVPVSGVEGEQFSQDVLDLEDSAPLVGLDVRLERRLTSSLWITANAGWRVSWLRREVFAEGATESGTEPVHVFPLTVGLTLSL